MTLRLGLTLGVILLLAVVQAQSDPCVLPPNVGNAYVGKPEAYAQTNWQSWSINFVHPYVLPFVGVYE